MTELERVKQELEACKIDLIYYKMQLEACEADLKACITKHAYSDCEFCAYKDHETEEHKQKGGCHACNNHGGFSDCFEWRGYHED